MANEIQTAPDGAALLIIDMVNDYDFGHAEQLLPWLDGVVEEIRLLRDQADALGVPVIYVNDNYDHWHSDRDRIFDEVAERSRRPDLVAQLRPRGDDYLVIKSKFSGFFATDLPALLSRLGVGRLILTGVAADICVLFTAADAYMRDYGLWVPPETTASHSDERRDWALDILAKSMHAETRSTADLSLEEWLHSNTARSAAPAHPA